MPGVPSGRGCNACREQKKKCDQAKPRCSRCTRLKIPCVGAGVQRFKFQDETANLKPGKSALFRVSKATPGKSTAPNPDALHDTKNYHFFEAVAAGYPRSINDRLTPIGRALVENLSNGNDFRFRLSFAYGAFLDDVPRRLGTNKALDTAVETMISAYNHFRTNPRSAAVEPLVKYNSTLRAIREVLNDPHEAVSTNTLCAIIVALICQHLIGMYDDFHSAHCEGAFQILKHRAYQDPNDIFEQGLVLKLQTALPLYALLYNGHSFARVDWTDLMENSIDDSNILGRLIKRWTHIPILGQRAKRAPRNGPGYAALAWEARELLLDNAQDVAVMHQVLEASTALKTTANGGTSDESDETDPKKVFGFSDRGDLVDVQILSSCSTYAFTLSIHILVTCILRGLGVASLEDEEYVADYCEEMLRVSEIVNQYRPLCGAFMDLYLTIAYGAATGNLKEKIRLALADYHGDFPRMGRMPLHQVDEMVEKLGNLDLADSESPPSVMGLYETSSPASSSRTGPIGIQYG